VRLYTWRRTGLADEVGSDAIPDAAGGEGGHEAAKPDSVIHRYLFYRRKVSSVQVAHYLIEHPTSRCECFSAYAMAIQKKHGKGRLDKWYKLAKEKGMYLTQICAINSLIEKRLQSAGGV
jgi:hypothetical protein